MMEEDGIDGIEGAILGSDDVISDVTNRLKAN